MSVVVVRCPVCKGQSRVGPEAVGMTVACPLCQSAFEATPESAPPPPAPPVAPRQVEPVVPRIVGKPKRPVAEPVAPPPSAVFLPTDAVELHDPGSGLPATVLVGLALLPFLIPLLWVLAPAAAGQDPVLSIAAPTALAIAASALCLAVVYTVDWTPSTRVKGVFILVGLSYFTGVSLYYLKKDTLDRVKRFFGAEWQEFRPPAEHGDCKVDMPHKPVELPAGNQPLQGWKLTYYRAVRGTKAGGGALYTVGCGPDARPRDTDEAWFDRVKPAVTGDRNDVDEKPMTDQAPNPGRQWTFPAQRAGFVMAVRVYRANGRVYYLSADVPKDMADDEGTAEFFTSFRIGPAEKK